jgi:hypothetical protein
MAPRTGITGLTFHNDDFQIYGNEVLPACEAAAVHGNMNPPWKYAGHDLIASLPGNGFGGNGNQDIKDPRLPLHMQIGGTRSLSGRTAPAFDSEKPSNLSLTVQTYGCPPQILGEQDTWNLKDRGTTQSLGGNWEMSQSLVRSNDRPSITGRKPPHMLGIQPQHMLKKMPIIARPEEFIEEPMDLESMYISAKSALSQGPNYADDFDLEDELSVPDTPDGGPRLQRQFAKTKLCRFARTSRCVFGARCSYAHSRQELVHKLDLRKTRLCKNFLTNECMDENCNFAHDFSELRSSAHVYKTKLCRWWKGGCKAGNACRFAHDPQELEEQLGAYQNTDEDARHEIRQYQAAASMQRASMQQASGERLSSWAPAPHALPTSYEPGRLG